MMPGKDWPTAGIGIATLVNSIIFWAVIMVVCEIVNNIPQSRVNSDYIGQGFNEFQVE
jgi:hypothetical protein